MLSAAAVSSAKRMLDDEEKMKYVNMVIKEAKDKAEYLLDEKRKAVRGPASHARGRIHSPPLGAPLPAVLLTFVSTPVPFSLFFHRRRRGINGSTRTIRPKCVAADASHCVGTGLPTSSGFVNLNADPMPCDPPSCRQFADYLRKTTVMLFADNEKRKKDLMAKTQDDGYATTP